MEINCSLKEFYTQNFSQWETEKIKFCLVEKGNEIGNNVWPNHATAGFLVIIILVIIWVIIYWRKR